MDSCNREANPLLTNQQGYTDGFRFEVRTSDFGTWMPKNLADDESVVAGDTRYQVAVVNSVSGAPLKIHHRTRQ